MKRSLLLLLILFSLELSAQSKFKYGLVGGMNLCTGVLPDLLINTDINSILEGDAVVEGTPQLADFVSLYKVGVFFKLDYKVISPKINITYTKTNIHKDVDASIFTINALDIDLSYLDIDLTMNINLLKHFYISAGYIPSILLDHEGNLNVKEFDPRILTGFGFKFANGASIDFDAVLGLQEIIEGSYIRNLMIPITFTIPLN
jgi:hypothetical protein